jgi:hydroxypyruvate reductase/glycerate 2-kinase
MNPTSHPSQLRQHALAIWQAAVDAVRPEKLIPQAIVNPGFGIQAAATRAPRILVIGAGKAGAAMSAALENVLPDCLARMDGIVNVPANTLRPLKSIRLHAARPTGTNQPTLEGVEGARQILDLVAGAGQDDVAIGLWSGGGSALLPAPVDGVSLADKQKVTELLHECGATINEMNAVRKHLSRIKGGRLAHAFTGDIFISLIISDVIGDQLDVIASGPTAEDPTTFADALTVLDKYALEPHVPAGVRDHLMKGARGLIRETAKTLSSSILNFIIGNNVHALIAAQSKAYRLGYHVRNLGSGIEGETNQVATEMADVAQGMLAEDRPERPPLCLLSGGETTVTLGDGHGLGGRNQEFVLAAINKLGLKGMTNVVVLSGGTDGEDGPTDAAGAIADVETLLKADKLGLSPQYFLTRHDSYHFFLATGDLLKTGLTETNVMDVRVILIAG